MSADDEPEDERGDADDEHHAGQGVLQGPPADGEPGPDPGLVNAALMTRDVVVTGLSERSLSVLDGLMRGRRQQDIADDLGISASAVSQRVRAEGIGVVLAADELLREL